MCFCWNSKSETSLCWEPRGTPESASRLHVSLMLCVILEWSLGQWTINKQYYRSLGPLCVAVSGVQIRCFLAEPLCSEALPWGTGREVFLQRGTGPGAQRPAQGAAETSSQCEQDFLKLANNGMGRGPSFSTGVSVHTHTPHPSRAQYPPCVSHSEDSHLCLPSAPAPPPHPLPKIMGQGKFQTWYRCTSKCFSTYV